MIEKERGKERCVREKLCVCVSDCVRRICSNAERVRERCDIDLRKREGERCEIVLREGEREARLWSLSGERAQVFEQVGCENLQLARFQIFCFAMSSLLFSDSTSSSQTISGAFFSFFFLVALHSAKGSVLGM